MAGYSQTPLIKKLGIKPALKLLLENAPSTYFEWLGEDLRDMVRGKGTTVDFVHLFAKDIAAFEKGMKKIRPAIEKNSSITVWVSWYKRASGIKTDLNEDIIRNYALANGLVDVKVCAVTEEWSGLKLVVPLAKRK